MELRIDKFGRIVLPKPLRDRLGAQAGAVLDARETADGGILLRASVQAPQMARVDRLWIHLGKLPKGSSWESVVDDFREDEVRRKSGL